MAFETFKKQRVPLTTEPAVTIQRRGNFSLNPPAYRALGSPDAVELLYDRDQRLIALRKVDPSTDHAYLVRPLNKGTSSWLISGMAFTAYYGIDTSIARRWIGSLDGELLVLDLKQPGTEVSSNRDRATVQRTDYRAAAANGMPVPAQLPGPNASGSPTAALQASPQSPDQGGGGRPRESEED